MLADGQRLHLHDGPIDLIIGAEGAEGGRLRSGPGAFCNRAGRTRRRAAAAPPARWARTSRHRRPPHVARHLAFRRSGLHHPHGRRRGLGCGGGAACHAVRGRRSPAPSSTMAATSPSISPRARPMRSASSTGRTGPRCSRPPASPARPRARHRNERLARPLLLARHRGCRHGAGGAREPLPMRRQPLIANAVDLPGHPAVTRVPAREIQPDNDLGERLVTRGVGPLTANEIAAALDAGVALAQRLVGEGRITAAALHLAGETRTVGQGLGRLDAGREGEEVPRLGGGNPS